MIARLNFSYLEIKKLAHDVLAICFLNVQCTFNLRPVPRGNFFVIGASTSLFQAFSYVAVLLKILYFHKTSYRFYQLS